MEAYQSVFNLLETWGRNVQRAQIANHESANWYSRCNVALGVPTILVTAAVGASAVTDVLTDQKWALALLSVLATTLTTLQAFLGLSDRSSKHANAGTEYGILKRRIQEFKALGPHTPDQIQTFVKEAREGFDNLTRATPQIPTFIWRGALEKVPPSSKT